MRVQSHINGVAPFEVPAEQRQWALTALKAAHERLGWRSLQIAIWALESPDGQSGADDGYNLSASARVEYRPYPWGGNTEGEISWVVLGGCGYGSRIEVRPDSFRVQSCSGHVVAGRWASYGCVKWEVDDLPSARSWGDGPDGEPADVAARVASLEAAWQRVREVVTA